MSRGLIVVGCIVLVLMSAMAQGAEVKMGNVSSSMDIKLYGYIKLDAAYDSQRTSAGDLMFYVLPEVNGERDGEFNMTAKETRLGLDITGPATDSMKTTGKVEADFYGPGGSANSPNLRLRLAYVNVAMDNGFSMRAGQDWETFINVIPRIVNFSYLADCGALGLRRPQFRLSQEIGKGDTKVIASVAAARTIGQDIDGGGQDDGADAEFPTFQYNLALQTKILSSKPTKIGVSGHFGRETVDGAVSNKITTVDEEDYDTWSVIGSLIFPLTDGIALQGTIWAGENLDTYFGGVGQGINATLKKGIAAKGGFAQVLVDVTDCLNWNLGYGLDDPDDGDLSKGNRGKNEMIFTSLFYKFNSALTFAAEYSYMKTQYIEGDDAKNNRIQGSAIFKF